MSSDQSSESPGAYDLLDYTTCMLLQQEYCMVNISWACNLLPADTDSLRACMHVGHSQVQVCLVQYQLGRHDTLSPDVQECKPGSKCTIVSHHVLLLMNAEASLRRQHRPRQVHRNLYWCTASCVAKSYVSYRVGETLHSLT